MGELQYTDVFVPGGFPRYTYNPRLSLKIEQGVEEVIHNLCKLVTVTGHTKSGKTVLVQKVLPREEAVWVDGGAVGEQDDFWNVILEQLDLFQTTETESAKEDTTGLAASVGASTNILVAKGEAEVSGTLGIRRSTGAARSRTVSSKVAALGGLRRESRALVVDDFHYLPRQIQGELIRALKPLIFDGVPVVIIAIPHRRYDAIKVEKEMTGRILPLEIPSWSEDELRYIPDTGFSLLNTKLDEGILARLTAESIGSPHLMQDFCRGVCRASQVMGNMGGRDIALSESDIECIFNDIAETIGRPIFDKLAKGPRQRSDRLQRTLKTGTQVDIYGLVLHALARLRPGLVTLEYEDLRKAIREISAETIPQLQEVARVLKHMSAIAATDQSSTPVIDFDEEEKRLHVTDPFFAFYLRWGKIEI